MKGKESGKRGDNPPGARRGDDADEISRWRTARTRQSDKVDPISRAAHDSRPAPRLVPQFRLGYPLVFCERERPVLPPRGPRGLAISERNFLRSAHYMSGIDFTAATRPRASAELSGNRFAASRGEASASSRQPGSATVGQTLQPDN